MEDEKKSDSITWVSDFDKRSLEELRHLIWTFHPGAIVKNERPERKSYSFPDSLNIITLGPARTGKSSYINSLMSIVDPNTEVTQSHSEIGNEFVTGTVRLEGPFCINDFRNNKNERTVLSLWTTKGFTSSILDGNELERDFVRFMKSCFLGKIKPGEYSGVMEKYVSYNPLLKRLIPEEPPKYNLAIVTARYGDKADAAQAIKLFDILNKQNNIPTIVVVTHAGNDITSWPLLSHIDPGCLFFVDNYIPKERLTHEKSKTLVIPLLEAIKKIERSDIYWSSPEVSFLEIEFYQNVIWVLWDIKYGVVVCCVIAAIIIGSL